MKEMVYKKMWLRLYNETEDAPLLERMKEIEVEELSDALAKAHKQMESMRLY